MIAPISGKMAATRLPYRHAAAASTGRTSRVVVAMSGGVDSAVAAALLKRQGLEVIGITLQLYDHGGATRRNGACCAGRDIHDARRVAAQLDIPHYVLDYEARFRSAVIDTFADSYARGETPIPCVSCNREIKFNDLLSTAEELGADLLATGHYIERRDGADGPALYRAADATRDQSYFLFATTPNQLERLCFPLGQLTKAEVRAIAGSLGIPVAAKPDSQDICFVADGHYADVIKRLRPEAVNPGEIVHIDGRVLGGHNGVIHFTIGQRKGLGVAAGDPLYVLRIEPERARVVVGPRECLAIDTLWLRDVNWLSEDTLATALEPRGLDVHVRVRSTQIPRPALLFVEPATSAVGIRLPGGELGVAKGQACVFYSDGGARSRLLGGGFIAGSDRCEAAKAA